MTNQHPILPFQSTTTTRSAVSSNFGSKRRPVAYQKDKTIADDASAERWCVGSHVISGSDAPNVWDHHRVCAQRQFILWLVAVWIGILLGPLSVFVVSISVAIVSSSFFDITKSYSCRRIRRLVLSLNRFLEQVLVSFVCAYSSSNMRFALSPRGSVDELVTGMESNVQWVEVRNINKRQGSGSGFLSDIIEGGKSATEFLGGLFGGGPATTTAPASTETVCPQ
jgi:hypothetical protein